jgi:RNA-binding protein
MLSVKQKVKLRSMAMTLNPIYQIGKDGITNNLLEGLSLALEAHELIKVSVLKTVSAPIREVALDVTSATHSELVQIIGRQIILYRQSKKQIIKF